MLVLFDGISKGREGKSHTLFSPGNNCGSIRLLKKQIQIQVEKHA